MPKILIASAGRSGTVFTSRLLAKYGFDCGHEHLGRDGLVGWTWIKQPVADFDLVLHQIREPLATIRSCMTHVDELFIQGEHAYGPRPIPQTLVHRKLVPAMWYYYQHNTRGRALSSWSYRVEDLTNPSSRTLVKLLFCFGVSKAAPIKPFPPTNVNSRQGIMERYDIPQLSWNMLSQAHPGLCTDIKTLTAPYGYDTTDKETANVANGTQAATKKNS